MLAGIGDDGMEESEDESPVAVARLVAAGAAPEKAAVNASSGVWVGPARGVTAPVFGDIATAAAGFGAKKAERSVSVARLGENDDRIGPPLRGMSSSPTPPSCGLMSPADDGLGDVEDRRKAGTHTGDVGGVF